MLPGGGGELIYRFEDFSLNIDRRELRRGDDLVAIEPMAAPTDSLCRGGYRFAVAGKPETAAFSITVG